MNKSDKTESDLFISMGYWECFSMASLQGVGGGWPMTEGDSSVPSLLTVQTWTCYPTSVSTTSLFVK